MSGLASRPFAGGLAAALLLVGCGAAQMESSSAALASYNDRTCLRMAHCGITSSQMRFSMTPDHGPPGTLVTLSVSGCIDPSRNDHALSYNAVGDLALGSTEVHRLYPRALAGIRSVLRGESLTGTFKVTYAPRPAGVFFAQCLDTVVAKTFRLTR